MITDPHDNFRPVSVTKSFEVVAAEIVVWLETLAPTRLWLSRQFVNQHNYSVSTTTKHNVLERYWRQQLKHRRGWTYVDHREAWRCEPKDTFIPTHPGSIGLLIRQVHENLRHVTLRY